MKHLFLLLSAFALINCGTKQTSSHIPETLDSIRPAVVQAVVNEQADPEGCDCPKPYETAETRIQIDYENGKYLKFCAWDFSPEDSTAAEFAVFDQTDSLLLEGMIPSQFAVLSLEPPLKLTQSTFLDLDGQEPWERLPIFRYEFELGEQGFHITRKFIFQPPGMTQASMDAALALFQAQPKHHGQYDPSNPPFASERHIVELFLCAVNGNEACIQAHDSLQTRFVTDGAIGELYYELNALLRVYKRERNQ